MLGLKICVSVFFLRFASLEKGALKCQFCNCNCYQRGRKGDVGTSLFLFVCLYVCFFFCFCFFCFCFLFCFLFLFLFFLFGFVWFFGFVFVCLFICLFVCFLFCFVCFGFFVFVFVFFFFFVLCFFCLLFCFVLFFGARTVFSHLYWHFHLSKSSKWLFCFQLMIHVLFLLR